MMSSWYFNRLFLFSPSLLIPPLHPIVFLLRAFFRGISGVKIHETREQSRRWGRREKKSDKGEGSAAERARTGKINCGRRRTAIKSVLTGPWRSRGNSMFKQQIAHRRFMNARRQVPFDIRVTAGTNKIPILSSRNRALMKKRIVLQHAFATTSVFMWLLRFDV